jgi:AraC-like DNA-binding protein
MNIPFNSSVILLAMIICNGLFTGILLSIQRKNALPNRFLGLLLLSFSLWLCDSFFRVAGIYQQNPNYYFLPIYYSFAFGPLVYYYTKSLTGRDFQLQAKALWHFLPVLFQAGLYFSLQFQNYNYRRWFWFEVHQPYTYNLEFIITLLSLLWYSFLSFQMIKDYQSWIRNQYSEVSAISLRWLGIMLIMISILSSLWLVDLFLRIFLDIFPLQSLSEMAMGIILIIMAVGGLFQSNLNTVGIEKETNIPPDQPDLDEKLLNQILNTMQKEEPFLEANLTLVAFAERLQQPAREISRHINQGLDKNFLDFVNYYRVEKVKKLIEANQYPELTLLGIALESGFNSKSSFNRVFKKMTGKSPSEYQKEAQNRK